MHFPISFNLTLGAGYQKRRYEWNHAFWEGGHPYFSGKGRFLLGGGGGAFFKIFYFLLNVLGVVG